MTSNSKTCHCTDYQTKTIPTAATNYDFVFRKCAIILLTLQISAITYVLLSNRTGTNSFCISNYSLNSKRPFTRIIALLLFPVTLHYSLSRMVFIYKTLKQAFPFRRKNKIETKIDKRLAATTQTTLITTSKKRLETVHKASKNNANDVKSKKFKGTLIECDICSIEQSETPCIYNPHHKAFYCFECYDSWKQHQEYLDELTHSKSDSIIEINLRKLNKQSERKINNVMQEELISCSTTPLLHRTSLSFEGRKQEFRQRLSQWQSLVKGKYQ